MNCLMHKAHSLAAAKRSRNHKGEFIREKRTILYCKTCGKPFEVIPSQVKRRKCCSRECDNRTKKGKLFHNHAFKKGQTPWNKNVKGIHLSPDTEFKKGNVSWWMEEGLPNLAYIYGEKRPTRPERNLISLVEKRKLPLRYVGDSTLRIGCLNPDFIATNGDKKVVEVFGCYWHGCLAHYPRVVSPIKREKNRRAYYHREGYDLFVMWEHDLESEQIMERLEEWLF